MCLSCIHISFVELNVAQFTPFEPLKQMVMMKPHIFVIYRGAHIVFRLYLLLSHSGLVLQSISWNWVVKEYCVLRVKCLVATNKSLIYFYEISVLLLIYSQKNTKMNTKLCLYIILLISWLRSKMLFYVLIIWVGHFEVVMIYHMLYRWTIHGHEVTCEVNW